MKRLLALLALPILMAATVIGPFTLHSGSGTGAALRCVGAPVGAPACTYATHALCVKAGEARKLAKSVCKAANVWSADPVARAESAEGTAVPPAVEIVDRELFAWTISGGVVYRGGMQAGHSAGVVKLFYKAREVVQMNDQGRTWAWRSGAWVEVTTPTSWVEPGYWHAGVYFSPASMGYGDVNTGTAGFRPCASVGQTCVGVGDVIYGSAESRWSMLRSQGSLLCSAEMFDRLPSEGASCLIR